MSIQSNDYHGLWRASANEGVPYSEDFSDALLTLPEFIDGALGAGNASIIDIEFDITNPKDCELIVRDNGKGIVSEKRMKDWSSKDIGNNDTENVYGHGSKKALSKFAPDFVNAKWTLYYRKQDKKGLSGALNILSSPFNGLETKHIEDDENEDICPNHGTCWKIKFNKSVLGKNQKPSELMCALQEIIRTRYEPAYFKPYIINISVRCGETVLKKNSKEWKSLKECLEDEIANGNVRKTHNSEITIDKTTATYCLYEIIADGRTYKMPEMPTFGRRNMNSSRVHLARNGRYIEAMQYPKFMGKESHNSDNGKIGFVTYTGDELPTPCTTKVKFQEECPIFKKMNKIIIDAFNIPAAKQVVAKPIKIEKTVPKPIVAQPIVAQPIVAQPIVAQPIVAQPIVAQPIVAQPTEIAKTAPKPVAAKTLPKSLPSQPNTRHPTEIAKPVPKQFVAQPTEIAKILPNPVAEKTVISQPVIAADDRKTIEDLYNKYGYKLCINLLNEINMPH
jgi:hypothetical protein